MKSIETRVEKLENQVSQPQDEPFLFVSVADEDELEKKRAELADHKGFVFYAVSVGLDAFPEQSIGA